jgi:hypothetical protein
MTEAVEQAKGTDRRARRAVILSVGFPVVGWFFGARVGLIVAVVAVAVLWTIARPQRLLWPAAVGMLAVAPFAIWAQGLPRTRVVGADFGVRHWIANDLVISALVVASFAALVELLHLDAPERGGHWIRGRAVHPSGWRAAPSETVLEGAVKEGAGAPPAEPSPPSTRSSSRDT